MTTQKRAKNGGEIGPNGEAYKGGQFIATTDKPKKQRARVRSTRKQQFEPFKWDVPPTPEHFAIFMLIGTQCEYVNRMGDDYRIQPASDQVLSYYGDTFRGRKITDLCDLWNAGERWAKASPEWLAEWA